VNSVFDYPDALDATVRQEKQLLAFYVFMEFKIDFVSSDSLLNFICRESCNTAQHAASSLQSNMSQK